MPKPLPESTKTKLRRRLSYHAARLWPALAEVKVDFRGMFAYVEGQLPDGTSMSLCRLRYHGSPYLWGFAIYLAGGGRYQDSMLPSGTPVGTAEEALDCACGVYLNNPADPIPPPDDRHSPIIAATTTPTTTPLLHPAARRRLARGREWATRACCVQTPWTACARHGITGVLYWQMMYAQQGVCAICGQCAYRDGEIVPLGIDHDHACCDAPTGCARCVRGLLCSPCGGWLGAYERQTRFPGLAGFLARHRTQVDAYLATPTTAIVRRQRT
ncbi:endonuclease domain-containing protein [Dactylosporangium darangshiense]|uniref:Recombination endonuclease VII n=1 Tax=Dactylosporangium darangshiense TaxID=579108 RepID=A0ABP8DVI6_9ACTN